jgi:hypothetical protein
MITQNQSAPASVIVLVGDSGQFLAVKKEFKTGSVGYYANGKVVIDNQVYQAGITLTLIGSKPE